MNRIFRIAVVGRRCGVAAFAIGAARQHGPTVNLDVWLGTRGARPSDLVSVADSLATKEHKGHEGWATGERMAGDFCSGPLNGISGPAGLVPRRSRRCSGHSGVVPSAAGVRQVASGTVPVVAGGAPGASGAFQVVIRTRTVHSGTRSTAAGVVPGAADGAPVVAGVVPRAAGGAPRAADVVPVVAGGGHCSFRRLPSAFRHLPSGCRRCPESFRRRPGRGRAASVPFRDTSGQRDCEL